MWAGNLLLSHGHISRSMSFNVCSLVWKFSSEVTVHWGIIHSTGQQLGDKKDTEVPYLSLQWFVLIVSLSSIGLDSRQERQIDPCLSLSMVWRFRTRMLRTFLLCFTASNTTRATAYPDTVSHSFSFHLTWLANGWWSLGLTDSQLCYLVLCSSSRRFQ